MGVFVFLGGLERRKTKPIKVNFLIFLSQKGLNMHYIARTRVPKDFSSGSNCSIVQRIKELLGGLSHET